MLFGNFEEVVEHVHGFLEFAEEEREHLELLIREYRALVKRNRGGADKRRLKPSLAKRSASRSRAGSR